MFFDHWRFAPDDLPRLREQIRPLIGDEAERAIGIEQSLIARDALEQLPALLHSLGARAVLLVMDDVPMRRGDDDLKPMVLESLAAHGFEVQVLRFDGHGDKVHADSAAVERVTAALRPGVAALALGAGTICDITKHASYQWNEQHGGQHHGPLVIVPTAASVAAYAINLAVILTDGVKRSLRSRWPSAVVSDLRLLQSAPQALSSAGFADLVPRYSTAADWLLSDTLGISTGFPPDMVAALDDCDRLLDEDAAAVGQNDEVGLARLMGANVLVGVLIGTTGESTLLSGWEHVISHTLDMSAAFQGRSTSLHGAQVGVTALLTSIAYQRLYAHLDPASVDLERCYPTAAQAQARISAAFDPIDPSGRMAAECWRDYGIKLAAWQANRERFAAFLAGWPEGAAARIKSYVRPPEQVAAALRKARAPMLPEQLDPPISAEQLRFAMLRAHLIRRRFTIGDLLFFLGWLDEAFADELIAEARRL